MKTRLCRSLWFAGLATLAPAQQQQEQCVRGTLLVCGAPPDIVLNQPLLVAIIDSDSMHKALASAVAPEVASLNGYTVELPAAQPAGVFQIAFNLVFTSRDPWPPERTRAVQDAAVGELQRALDRLMYELPRDALTKRQQELAARFDQLDNERRELLARAGEVAGADVDTARKRLQELQDRLADAEIEQRTSDVSLQRLDDLLQKTRKELNERQHASDELTRRNMGLLGKINNVQSRIIPSEVPSGNEQTRQQQEQTRQQQLPALRAELEQLQADRDRTNAELGHLDQERELPRLIAERTAQQIADSTLARERAEARLQVLHAQLGEQQKLVAAAQAQGKERAGLEAQADRRGGDAAIVRTLLTEVQGRLERLEPVRYEVIRSQ